MIKYPIKLNHPDRLAVIILVATWFIFFSRTITGQFVYFFDDLKIIYFPLEWAYAQFQQQGQLPLWSNLFGFGHPLLAWGQLGFFTPLHLFLRTLHVPPLALLQVSIVVYFLLGSIGMYLFLRSQKIVAPASTLGALIFTYCGFHIGHLTHINFFTSTMLLPWLLLALHYLVTYPALKHAIIVAVVAAALTLSGQPQIALYSLAIAGLWFAVRLTTASSRLKILGLIALAGILAFSLSSFSILPLAEFLPLTERADGLTKSELLEFSYPPHHAITLILPYFFGDHNYYWGAKNFQELAAYVGIIPLLLAGFSLSLLKRKTSLKTLGLILIAISIIFGLGKYSPVYLALVSHGYIKSLAIPGRFTFFFIVGITLLASTGFHDLLSSTPKQRKVRLGLGVLALLLLMTPFIVYSFTQTSIYYHLPSVISTLQLGLILLLLGLTTLLVFVFLPSRITNQPTPPFVIAIIAAITLICFGWHYNPITPLQTAFVSSPFQSILNSYSQQSLYQPRLFQVEHPSISAQRRTEPISTTFSIHQPIVSQNDPISCFSLPFQQIAGNINPGNLTISLSTSIGGPPLRSTTINPSYLTSPIHDFCFDPLPTSPNDTIYLNFTSTGHTGLRLVYRPSPRPGQQAYFIRVSNPTQQQIQQSKKGLAIIFYQQAPTTADIESLKLARHINVTANASSANWIGALGIKPFRTFVTTMLDDDFDPFHYDSPALINSRRTILDLAGISHLIEKTLPHTDYNYLSDANFTMVTEASYQRTALRLHHNPTAYPKAFLVPNSVFSPAHDETIHAMKQPSFSPKDLAYISGPAPPDFVAETPSTFAGSASLNHYDNIVVNVETRTNQPSWLVVTDTATPQWQTFIDGQPAPYYTAYTMFKAALVPAGHHTVTWRYHSPASIIAKYLTTIGLLFTIILTILVTILPRRSASRECKNLHVSSRPRHGGGGDLLV